MNNQYAAHFTHNIEVKSKTKKNRQISKKWIIFSALMIYFVRKMLVRPKEKIEG